MEASNPDKQPAPQGPVTIDPRTSRTDMSKPPMTGNDWLESGMVGLWADRVDIADSGEFARKLREQVWQRRTVD